MTRFEGEARISYHGCPDPFDRWHKPAADLAALHRLGIALPFDGDRRPAPVFP